MPTATRKPWLAGILSFFVPGLGHVYAGNPPRGLLLWFSMICVAMLVIFVRFSALFLIGLFLGFAIFLFIIVDAMRMARAQREDYEPKAYNTWYVYLAVIVGTCSADVAITDYIRASWVQAYKIPMGSMNPTLLNGDHIFVDKAVYRSRNPERGDIVVFKFPGDENKEFVKRVIGLPGETVEIRNKLVLVNGKEFVEPYVLHVDPSTIPGSAQPRDNLDVLSLPQDYYFLLGDNRERSLDSRFFGPVSRTKITGKAMMIYWCWDGGIKWERIGKAIH